ncbi:MAG: endoribonuclease YbeY [Tepidiforma sp.]|nr:rRNA maturation RNase YbeY [Tepidiforma sp.]MCX7617457.1 rRNA maturation RNase YbeY [Tepidiforma sp.]GIW17513.1 MAG: endoribonuclease YbeY [Tepidiforma sp.]
MPADPAYDITFETEVDVPDADLPALESLAARVMAGEDVPLGTALAVVITDDEEIRRLNAEFLGVDEPTDVLSFPEDSPDDDDFVAPPDAPRALGDIAISIDTARRQAAQLGHSLQDELAHLLVHGILHLCGYDHVNSPDEEAEMRAREEHYLGDLRHFHTH